MGLICYFDLFWTNLVILDPVIIVLVFPGNHANRGSTKLALSVLYCWLGLVILDNAIYEIPDLQINTNAVVAIITKGIKILLKGHCQSIIQNKIAGNNMYPRYFIVRIWRRWIWVIAICVQIRRNFLIKNVSYTGIGRPIAEQTPRGPRLTWSSVMLSRYWMVIKSYCESIQESLYSRKENVVQSIHVSVISSIQNKRSSKNKKMDENTDTTHSTTYLQSLSIRVSAHLALEENFHGFLRETIPWILQALYFLLHYQP